MNDFAVFVLSNGRAKATCTLDMLIKKGYHGDWYYIVDTEDKQIQEYQERFGKDHVIIFDKNDYMGKFDSFDNFGNKRAVIFARLFVQDKAREMGYKYYAEFDDDIKEFEYRYVKDEKLYSKKLHGMDKLFAAMCAFLEISDAYFLSLGRPIHVIGGKTNKRFADSLIWGGNAIFVASTGKTIPWCCTVNEDTCTSIRMGLWGMPHFVYTHIVTHCDDPESGGMLDVHTEKVYQHKFAKVLLCPGGCKWKQDGATVGDNNIYPKILNERWKK